MNFYVLTSLALFFYVNFCRAKIDVDELKCLVCKVSMFELGFEVGKLDPNKKVQIGDGRLDADGNYKLKTVSQGKSELFLSELIEDLCKKMDDFVRATRKSDGKLEVIRLISDGQMNPLLSEYDIVQDDDLNKSLKYYCESIVEEHEDDIIKHVIEDHLHVDTKLCEETTNICPPSQDNEHEEL